MTDPATCEHFSIRSSGEIVCKLCGAVWVMDWRGPPHWQSPVNIKVNGESEFRKLYEQGPWPEPTVADCRKGSCLRHGRCMYLNHPNCPVRYKEIGGHYER